jgi:CRISPR-associated endonuclease/helicase Cas3
LDGALDVDHFPEFLAEVYSERDGRGQVTQPFTVFPWQKRLMAQVAVQGRWPAVLALPTGSGKTTALDVAVFHLALEADRGPARRAPLRIVLAVDRRLIVDHAYERAKRLAAALAAPPGPITELVRQRLDRLAAGGPPLVVRRLRGGVPREGDWARTPVQPTILCSTVDQVGSRLLFRGYGVSDQAKPIHAGLLGADCLILLDEAHLAEPFRQTLHWISYYRSPLWTGNPSLSPWSVSLLTATPEEEEGAFHLGDEDIAHPVLAARLRAAKPARLISVAEDHGPTGAADRPDQATKDDDRKRFLSKVVEEVLEAVAYLKASGVAAPAIGVVVNRVLRARLIHAALRQALPPDWDEPILMIGPARSVDRDDLAAALAPIQTRPLPAGGSRRLERVIVVVTTQCLEAGVDVDFDALITEAAPIDALQQRFGRLNRGGRDIHPYAAVVASKLDLTGRAEDPVYGGAIREAWAYLQRTAKPPDRRGGDPIVDFGVEAFASARARDPVPEGATSPRVDAPVLLPAHLDLFSHTSPVPAQDPDVSLFLHGPRHQPASVSVVWRADVNPQQPAEMTRRLLALVPPRAAEAIDLPVWAVRRWLADDARDLTALADVAEVGPDEAIEQGSRLVFRWTGDEDRSAWIRAADIRPGDTLVVPAQAGGVDRFGWHPESREPATDVAIQAASPWKGQRFVVRVAPGLLGSGMSATRLSEVLAATSLRSWSDMRDALLDLPLPDELKASLAQLDGARGPRRANVDVHLDLYGFDDQGRPQGVVFVAKHGLVTLDAADADEGIATTEDDRAAAFAAVPIGLEDHCLRVAALAEDFARRAGLPSPLVSDLALAGRLHDLGKADPRFQAMLAYGDPLGPDPDHLLAKSGRLAVRDVAARVGLPPKWRHEALSVRLAVLDPRFATSLDAELVLWLIGTHHGYGRPLFPHADPKDAEERHDLAAALDLGTEVILPGPSPASLAYDFGGLAWPDLYERLKSRYGAWDLARLEGMLRLADHRASEAEREEGLEHV